MNAYSVSEGQNCRFGCNKSPATISEGKFQLLNPWDKIPFATIFYHFTEFSATASKQFIQTIKLINSHKHPFKKGHKTT